MKNTFGCLFLIFCFQICFGQETSFLNEYDNLIQINGFKQNSVKKIVVDNNGMSWIATELGLYSFDGQSLNEITDKKYPSISKQRINFLAVDVKTGQVCFSTYPEGFIYVIINNKIYRKGVENDFYRTFFTSENKLNIPNLKVATKIVSFFKKQNYYYSWNSETSLFSNNNITYYSQKKIVLAINKSGEIKKINHHFSEKIRLLKFDNNIILFDKGKAALIEGTKLKSQKIDVSPILISKSDTGYFIYGEENNYFFHSKGIIYSIKYKNFKITTEPVFRSPKKDILSIFYNKKDKIFFIGTNTNGMFITKYKQFSSLSPNNDSKNSCYSVIKNNNIWYTSTGWSFNRKERNVSLDFSYPNRNVRFLLKYKNDIYFEDSNIFINVKTKQKINSLSFKNEELEHYPATSYTYINNRFWYSNLKNIFYLENGFLKKDNFITSKINKSDIYQIINFNDYLLIATTKGIYKYKPFTLQIERIKGLENNYTRYIKIIDKNSFWVGCYGDGLFLIKNNKAYKVNDKNINISTAHAIEEDKKGFLWITTNEGLLFVNKKEAITKTLQNKTIECYLYTIDDGLITNEFNGGCTQPYFRDTDGILGFPCIKGLIWFYPERMKQHTFTNKIFIDDIYADGKIITLKNNKYSIPSNTKLISFDLIYPYYFNRKNLSVEYRFQDETIWNELKEKNLKIVRTKTGDRKLLLRIRTHGVIQKQFYTKTILFDFEKQYFERIWFWVIIFIFLLIFLYFSYLIGVRLHKKREKILKERIKEKTSQLQTTILELESSKESLILSLKEKKILLKEVHHRVKNNHQLIISILNIQARRKNFSSINDFIKKVETKISSMALIHQNLYQSEDSLEKINFKEYIKDLISYINQTFENNDGKIKVEINIENVFLNLNTSVSLGLILNELITNSFKHAFPNKEEGKISILLKKIESNQFELVFIDNGIGFNKNTKKINESFGLELIYLLANQLNAKIFFESSKKTKYKITFKEIN